MAISKVIYGGQTLIDLTNDDVSADTVFDGVTFHAADGEPKTGTFTITPELTEQDALIDQINSALQRKTVGGGLPTQEKTVEITENGTHEIVPDEGYTLSKVTVNVNVESSGGGDTTMEDAFITGGIISGEYRNDRVSTISDYAFAECANLTSIDFSNVTVVKTYAFSNCRVLANVNMPLLETIGTRGFYFCMKLKVLDLPSLKSIAQYGLAQCQVLTALILRGETVCELAHTNAFTNTPIAKGTTGYIYVPSALIDSYKAATNWSTYANQFRAIEDYPEICGG